MIASRIDVTMQESSAWPAVKGGTPSPGRGACSAAADGGFLTARIAPSQTAAVPRRWDDPCQASSKAVISASKSRHRVDLGREFKADHSRDVRVGGSYGLVRQNSGRRRRRRSDDAPQQLHRKARRLAKRRQPIREKWLRRYHEVMDFAGTEFADHGGSDSSGARLRQGEGIGRQDGPSRRQTRRLAGATSAAGYRHGDARRQAPVLTPLTLRVICPRVSA